MPEIVFHTTFSTSHFPPSRAKNGSESGLWSAVSYRFGFNGKENDNEVKGTGNQQDYGARIYDNRLGRFLSADPLIVQEQKYPELSPYQFASNTPIWGIDQDGLEVYFVTDFYNTAGVLYKTVITVVNHEYTSGGASSPDQQTEVYRSRVDYTSATTATVSRVGTPPVTGPPTAGATGPDNTSRIWNSPNEAANAFNLIAGITVTRNATYINRFPANVGSTAKQNQLVVTDIRNNATNQITATTPGANTVTIQIDPSAAPANDFVSERTNAVLITPGNQTYGEGCNTPPMGTTDAAGNPVITTITDTSGNTLTIN